MFKTRKEEKQDMVKKFAVGAALTAAAGYVVGVLTAPKSGKETRQMIADKTNDTLAGAEKQLKGLHTELTDLIDQAADKVTEYKQSRKEGKDSDGGSVLDKGRDAKQKAREVLSALHDGETDDKELKKAIQDATKAIQHLRDFLKK